jgi:hypothetical protein
MLLKLFRSRYPQGSLVSELLQFEQGKYVVRVTIQLDRLILGTGLGAANTVEEAEDRARDRALALLNLEETPYLPEARSLNGMPSHRSGQSPAMPLPLAAGEATIAQEETNKEAEEIQVLSSSSHLSPATVQNIPSPLPSPSATTFAEVTPEVAEKRSPELEFDFPPSEPDPLPETQTPPAPIEPPTTAIETPPSVAEDLSPPPKLQTLTEPIDFSEVLAQTNIEIRRLQWTQEQGRKFLLERYGKRSRQVLTDEELLDFLAYLKSQ